MIDEQSKLSQKVLQNHMKKLSVNSLKKVFNQKVSELNTKIKDGDFDNFRSEDLLENDINCKQKQLEN